MILATAPKIAYDSPGLTESDTEDMQRRIPRLAEIRAQMRQIARSTESFEFVDLSRQLETAHYIDGFHPNAQGADHLAVRFATAVQSRLVNRSELRPSLEKATGKLAGGTFQGLETLTFDLEGHGQAKVTVLQPERALEGLPWVYFPGKLDTDSTWAVELADRGFHVVLAESDRTWTTLPVEIGATLQRAGFSGGIDGRTIMDQENPGAVTRAALRLVGASSDEAYPSTRPRSGVALDQTANWSPSDTWDSVSMVLDYIAQRIRHMDALFVGGTTVQDLTGHIHRAAQPGRGRAFDELAGPRRAASFGVSGERTEHLLWRIARGTFDPMTPNTVVVHVGAHNIIDANHSVHETFNGVLRVVDGLQHRYPGVRIVVCTPLPANAPTDSYVFHAVASLRAEIIRHNFGPGVRKADTGAPFANTDGSLRTTLSPDGMILTPEGRRIFLGEIRAILDPLLSF